MTTPDFNTMNADDIIECINGLETVPATTMQLLANAYSICVGQDEIDVITLEELMLGADMRPVNEILHDAQSLLCSAQSAGGRSRATIDAYHEQQKDFIAGLLGRQILKELN